MLSLLMLAAAAVAPPLPPAPEQAVFGAVAPVDIAVLDTSTAREDVSLIAKSDQAAAVSNNSVNGNSVTGAVTIDGNAFQNAQGLTLINANSGNNVAINSSLNVTISFAPAPAP